MKKKIYIAFAAVFAAVAALTSVLGARAAVRASAEEIALAKTCKSALIVDCDTGSVVFEKNTKEHLPIASMVKIMTLSLAFDEIEKREIPLDTTVVASENAASMGGSQAFLDANGEYRLDELLKSIVVASANDSCVAVAEYLYGSVDAFVAEMNSRAAEWNMTDTAFVNCTGLPKEGGYSCAADVAVMFKKLTEHSKFFEYAGEWMYDFVHPDGRITQLTNTNKLIRYYDGCDGGKTGYTDAARSCITVTAKRGDTRLICVAVGAENSKTRNKEVSEMLNYGFANYETKYAVRAGDEIGEYDVINGKVDTVKVVAESSGTVFAKRGDGGEITLEYLIDEIKAPIAAGDKVGEIVIKVNGEEHSRVSAVAAGDCGKRGYLDIVKDFIGEW